MLYSTAASTARAWWLAPRVMVSARRLRVTTHARAPRIKTACSLHLIGIILFSNVNLTYDTNKDTYPQTFGLGYLFRAPVILILQEPKWCHESETYIKRRVTIADVFVYVKMLFLDVLKYKRKYDDWFFLFCNCFFSKTLGCQIMSFVVVVFF